jgi:hypothetical protein
VRILHTAYEPPSAQALSAPPVGANPDFKLTGWVLLKKHEGIF